MSQNVLIIWKLQNVTRNRKSDTKFWAKLELNIYFSNSLIIYKENTKNLMSVWKWDEKLLIFASLISPSKIILFEK